MTSTEPTQPLTEEKLAAMREGYAMARSIPTEHLRQDTRDAIRLLDEVLTAARLVGLVGAS